MIYKYFIEEEDISQNYYMINDNKYIKDVKQPTINDLFNLLIYYYENFDYRDKFIIYLVGSFNSNKIYITNNIDLIITYKSTEKKNYKEIFECLNFFTHNAIDRYSIMVNTYYYEYFTNPSQYYIDYSNNNFDSSEKIFKTMEDKYIKYGEILSYVNYRAICNNKFKNVGILDNIYSNIVYSENNKNLYKFNNNIPYKIHPTFNEMLNKKNNETNDMSNNETNDVSNNYYVCYHHVKIYNDISYGIIYNEPLMLFNGTNFNNDLIIFENEKFILKESEIKNKYKLL